MLRKVGQHLDSSALQGFCPCLIFSSLHLFGLSVILLHLCNAALHYPTPLSSNDLKVQKIPSIRTDTYNYLTGKHVYFVILDNCARPKQL